MKRVGFSLAIVLLISGAIVAAENPIDKGSLIVGGNAYFMSQGGDHYKDTANHSQTTIGFQPSVGYFVAPSIMVGAQITFENLTWGDVKTTDWAIGPMAGYYFNIDRARTEVKGAIYPYVKGFFLYGQSKEENAIDTTTNVMTFGGQGGAVFMLSNAWGVDGGVLFKSESFKPKGSSESVSGTTFGVVVGITAFLF
jgi:hypothetical protein